MLALGYPERASVRAAERRMGLGRLEALPAPTSDSHSAALVSATPSRSAPSLATPHRSLQRDADQGCAGSYTARLAVQLRDACFDAAASWALSSSCSPHRLKGMFRMLSAPQHAGVAESVGAPGWIGLPLTSLG